jgi:hypothetical protein
MAIFFKSWAPCLTVCALLLVLRPAALQTTGKCASTYTTATGNTATVVANNCGCSSEGANIASTNKIATTSAVIPAGTLLTLPSACQSATPIYTPQATIKNVFTPQATIKNVFTPEATVKNVFTPESTVKNNFTSSPKYLTGASDDETFVPVPQPIPGAGAEG